MLNFDGVSLQSAVYQQQKEIRCRVCQVRPKVTWAELTDSCGYVLYCVSIAGWLTQLCLYLSGEGNLSVAHQQLDRLHYNSEIRKLNKTKINKKKQNIVMVTVILPFELATGLYH